MALIEFVEEAPKEIKKEETTLPKQIQRKSQIS